MKTIEEKARAYDEAFEKLRNFYRDYDTVSHLIDVKEELANLFPELVESEGEKIRKALVRFHKGTIDIDGIKGEDILAWLEKQGKQKPADKVEPKFKVKYAGNEYNVLDIKENMGITWYGIEDEPNHIDYVKANSCEIINVYGIKENGSPYPTKPAIFAGHNPSDEDMKEALRTEYEKGKAGAITQMQKEWSEEDECTLNGILDDYKSMCKTYRNWLESIKNRIQPQQKQEWSEEDENGLGDAIWCCKQAASIAKDENDMGNVWYAEHWLKSIKDRVQPKNHWKPSDGQMSALKIATHCPDLGLSRVLKTLYNDLDKLTKE